MNDHERSDYELQCQKLRAELKQWENDWARTSGGNKPSREDIKQNREISQKYKEYNKLRDILAGKTKPATNPPAAARDGSAEKRQQQKRKQDDAVLPPSRTPQKRSKHTQTPSKSQSYADVELSAAVTPSLSRKLFSPALPTSIGPTPQRDGRVLGLFDLLSATPSRSTDDEARSKAHARRIDATPSKRNTSAGDVVNDDTLTTPSADRLNRTPSSTKNNKMLLDELPGMMTPLNKRDRNLQPPNKTPSSRSTSKLHFATPAFLRRSTAPLPAVDENGEWKIEPIKLPRKPLVRGLSNMVASLRKLEEEALDDELDAMREMEMEAGESMFGPPSRKTKPATNNTTPNAAADQTAKEGDSHVGETEAAQQDKEGGAGDEKHQQQRPERPVLLGGFDDENLYDSQDEEQLDRGQPLRVFKKKGQKRTTRRVNIRPTRVKRPSAVNEYDSDDSQGGGGVDDDEVVPETQFDATKLVGQEGDDALLNDGGSDSEFGGSDFEHDNDDHDYDDDDVDDTRKKTNKRDKAASTKQEAGKLNKKDGGKDEGKKDEGFVRKGLRKVKATAHANFKRLKLRNSGAKGGPAHNSRFRRRR